MSDKRQEPLVVDIAEWVEKARHDRILYAERQATEIFLTAIAMTPYGEKIFLKGGILMGVIYKSPRQTADLDFTAALEPGADTGQDIHRALDHALPRAAANLGYPDIICRVQTITPYPRRDRFAEANFPALKVTVGYARRGTNQEKQLAKNNAPNVLRADISFNEPVGAIQIVRLGGSDAMIGVYSLIEVIAEKLRALLQQTIRNRYRRQDIYDIALLLKAFSLEDGEKAQLLALFIEKCRAREIEPRIESISDPDVIRRARSEWDTLKLELEELPVFDQCFALVEAFYRSLPWAERKKED